MDAYRKLLMALDFSTPSSEAVAQALALARSLDAEIELCHVVDTRYMTMAPVSLVEPATLQEERLRKSAHSRLERLVGSLSGDGVRLSMVVRCGVPADEILDEARRFGADVVVMGTHGRTGVRRALLGSQAEAVMRRCPVPVLVVHEKAEAPKARDPAGAVPGPPAPDWQPRSTG